MLGKVYSAVYKLDRIIVSKVSVYLMVLFAHLSRTRGMALGAAIPAGETGSSSSTSTTLSWHSPCQGSTPSNLPDDDDVWQDQPRPTKPLSQIYGDLASYADQSKTAVYGIMQKYILERFHDPLYAEQIAMFNIQGLPQTTSVDELTLADFDSSNIDAAATIQRMYDDISRVAVFLEQAILDEIAYEVEFNNNIHEELQVIEQHHVISMLCHLQRAMIALDEDIDFSITRQIMGQDTRVLADRALRQTRDFIALRELHKVFHSVRIQFIVLRRAQLATR